MGHAMTKDEPYFCSTSCTLWQEKTSRKWTDMYDACRARALRIKEKTKKMYALTDAMGFFDWY